MPSKTKRAGLSGKTTSGRSRRSRTPDDGLDLGSDKLYFKIGEVAEIVGVAPHVLRYWESEFRSIKPQKSRSQQRVYRRRDVETLLKIKHLLYEQKFTIAGARQQLSADRNAVVTASPDRDYRVKRSVEEVRRHLQALRSALDADEHRDPAAADPAAYLLSRRIEADPSYTEQDADSPQQPLLNRPARDAHS